jgi:hypothetical protein
MGYFNIIESLLDTRNSKEVVNEATSTQRDYKGILSQLEKSLLSCKDTTLHGDFAFLLYLCVGSMSYARLLPVFDVNKLHQKEDTKKGRGFIYLDINDVFKADNLVYYYIEDTSNKYSPKDVANFMINSLADTLKREEAFIMDDERYIEKFKNDFRDILGVDVETIDDAIKVIKSGSAYKKLSDLIIKGLDIALKEYVSNIKGLVPNSNKSVDMTNDTISICCVDTKKSMIYMSRFPGNDRFIVNPKKKDWNGYTFTFELDKVQDAVTKFKSLECFTAVDIIPKSRKESKIKDNDSGREVLSYIIYGG